MVQCVYQGGVTHQGRQRLGLVGQGGKGVWVLVELCFGGFNVEVGDGQLFQFIASVGGGQEVGADGSVKEEAAQL